MKYKGTLIAVKDIVKSKAFYKSVMGLDVVMDVGANVELTGGVFLQTVDTWVNFINKSDSEIVFSNNAIELYFEAEDIESFCKLLTVRGDICYVHPLHEHPWGQRVVRFYDPDRHIIEVGEDMGVVVRRFINSGLSVVETATRMGVPTAYVEQYLVVKQS
jgi:catechol 2,3-dioxygenase-like lactoylglutathione lyase family enzyme